MDHTDAMRRAYDLLNAGDLDGFAELLSDDFVEHEATPGLEPNKAGVLQFFTMYRAGFPDLRFEPEQFFATDDTSGRSWSARTAASRCTRRAGTGRAARQPRPAFPTSRPASSSFAT